MTSSQQEPQNGDLYLGPLHRLVNQDLNWAHERESQGDFAEYPGQYLAIVDRKVLAAGYRPLEFLAKAAESAGVPEERVALYWVDDGRWY